MDILVAPNPERRSNVLLRLSRLSSALAAAAALVALFGPEAERGLCADVALLLLVFALVLWRLALAVQRRRARPDDAVPAARSLGSEALRESADLVESRIAGAPSFEAALVAARDALRGELGAASARALVVQVRDHGYAVCEVVGGERPLRAPPVAVPQDGSALTCALASKRLAWQWPEAAALPVLQDGCVVAAIDLRRFEIEIDEAGRLAMIERAARALGARLDGSVPARRTILAACRRHGRVRGLAAC